MDIVVYHTGRLSPSNLEDLARSEKAIHGECGFRQWDLPTFAEHGRNYIFEADGEFAGSAQLVRDWDEPGTAYLAGFGLAPDGRGKGWGRLFLKELISLAAGEGITALELTVRPDNEAALRIYREAGFLETARHDGKYGCGEDRLVMRLNTKDVIA